MKEARAREIKTFLDIPVYDYAKSSEMEEDAIWVETTWVETNKGDDESPNIRSRLLAREIRTAG